VPSAQEGQSRALAKDNSTLDDRKGAGTRRGASRAIGRPTGKGRIGKELLIEKTAELLRTVPPEKLSLSVAARHAKVHLTLFKYYFQDRTRLLVDVARMLSKEIGDRVIEIEGANDAKSAPERLAIRVDAMVDFFLVNPFYHRLMVEIIDNETDPLATELINLWMGKTLEIYEGLIDAGVAEGTLRPIDPAFTFLAIMGLCEKILHAAKLAARTGESQASAAERYKAHVIELVLKGVGADGVASAGVTRKSAAS
jgi:AcrR family transcriptional regulator